MSKAPPPHASTIITNDLTQGSVLHHLFQLTGYTLFGLISIMVANLFESIFIGQLGTDALAAVGISFPFIMTLITIAMGMGIAASSLISRQVGLEQWHDAKRLTTHSLVFTFILSVVIGLMIIPYIDIICRSLGADDSIIALCVHYIQMMITGMSFFFLLLVETNALRAAGESARPGQVMIFSSLLQIVLSPIFIFGLYDLIPAMGLTGSGLAFITSRFFASALLLYLIWQRRLLLFSMKNFFASCRDILAMAVPAIIAGMINPLAMGILIRIIADYGMIAVASFLAAYRIEVVFSIVLWGAAYSVAPFSGQNWGAKKINRIQEAIRIGYKISIIWGIVSYIFLFQFGTELISLINNNPELMYFSSLYFTIHPIGLAGLGIVLISTHTFHAIGQPITALTLTLIHMIILTVPLAFIGSYLMNFQGIMLGIMLASMVSALIAKTRLRKDLYRNTNAS